jgi:DNA uptake protein ComE-like DNA-binding protein
MFKFARFPMGLLALTLAGPVMAQPATSSSPNTTAAPSTMAPASQKTTVASPKTDLIDINSAAAADLRMLPGVSDTDAAKIVQGRPYSDTRQLASRKVVSEATYDKIKDRVVARQQPKS